MIALLTRKRRGIIGITIQINTLVCGIVVTVFNAVCPVNARLSFCIQKTAQVDYDSTNLVNVTTASLQP